MTILLEAPRPGKVGDGEESYYHVTTPDGELAKHKRASDYTKEIDTDWALRRYEDRCLVYGMARHKDLWDLAHGHHYDTDKTVYDQTIIPQARARAAAESKANTGTALHRYLEIIDHGGQVGALPKEWHRHLQTYVDTIAAIPFRVVERYIEQVVILDGYRIAGTIDRVLECTAPVTVTFPNGRKIHLTPGDLIIGDLKTGKWGLKYNATKWPMQMGIYSQHTATWHKDDTRPHKGTRGPAIGVRADVALVIHLQANDPDAPIELHWLDLEYGYDCFLTAIQNVEARRDARKAHCQYTDFLPTAIDTQMVAWARARLTALDANPAAKACVQRLWPLRDPDTGHPIRYADQPPAEHTTALLDLLGRVEAEYQLPFTPQPGLGAPATNQQPTPATKE